MSRFFWHWFARNGIGVSIAFVVFDLATGALGPAAVQAMLLIGYLWLARATKRGYQQYQREMRRHELDLELEGDRLQRHIEELERELGIGGIP